MYSREAGGFPRKNHFDGGLRDLVDVIGMGGLLRCSIEAKSRLELYGTDCTEYYLQLAIGKPRGPATMAATWQVWAWTPLRGPISSIARDFLRAIGA